MVSAFKMPHSRRKVKLCTCVQRPCGGSGKNRVILTGGEHLNWASQNMQKFIQWDWTLDTGWEGAENFTKYYLGVYYALASQ